MSAAATFRDAGNRRLLGTCSPTLKMAAVVRNKWTRVQDPATRFCPCRRDRAPRWAVSVRRSLVLVAERPVGLCSAAALLGVRVRGLGCSCPHRISRSCWCPANVGWPTHETLLGANSGLPSNNRFRLQGNVVKVRTHTRRLPTNSLLLSSSSTRGLCTYSGGVWFRIYAEAPPDITEGFRRFHQTLR
jgi:hypothetical protein